MVSIFSLIQKRLEERERERKRERGRGRECKEMKKSTELSDHSATMLAVFAKNLRQEHIHT